MISKKIQAVMTDLGAIGKDSKNKEQGFNFRSIDAVYNVIHDIMAKHGVFSVPTILNRQSTERTSRNGGVLMNRVLTIQYRFYDADDGSFIDSIVDGEAMDSGDKATSKAMSIAHKYCLLQTFCIPTEDSKDPDLESHDDKIKGAPVEGLKNEAKEHSDW